MSIGKANSDSRKAEIWRYVRFVNCVIPESIWNWPRGKVDSRSWDAALDLVQQSLIETALTHEITDEENRVLTAVFMECEELRANKYLESVQTNRDVAKKYTNQPAHRHKLA